MPTLIVFAPHPDDETFGCGGTLAKRIEAGWTPVIVLVTDGRGLFAHYGIHENPDPQQVADARLQETIEAIDILGCPKEAIVELGFPNDALDAHEDGAVDRIAELLTEHDPAEIYVTNIHEGHKEHRLTNALVKRAAERVGYDGPCYQYIVNLHGETSLEKIDDARVSEDVAAWKEKKRRAVNCFRYHLDVISPEQEKPFAESFDHYATDEEIFFVSE